MGKLQTGRFERLAARTYSIKGPGALVDLDETVLGVLQLERQAGMESHYMQGWETFGLTSELAANAGDYSWMLISNPIGSDTIAVIDWYQRSNATATLVAMTRGIPPGFILASVAEGLDTRIPAARQPACNFYRLHTATSSFGVHVSTTADSGQQHYRTVLGEDGSMAFRSSAQNETLGLSIRWAERAAAPFEK